MISIRQTGAGCRVCARVLASVVGAGLAVAASGELPMSDRFIYETWQTEQGLPHNNVFSISQTPDGYLWLATSRGLTRFDGVRMVPLETPALSLESVRRLRLDSRGRLWLAPDRGGLVVITGKTDRQVTTVEGPYLTRAYDFIADTEGRIWTVTLQGHVERVFQDRVTDLGAPGRGLRGPSELALDGEGQVWLASRGVIGYFRNDEFVELLHDLTPPLAIARRRGGGVWAIAGQRLIQVEEDGRTRQLAELPWPARDTEVRQLLEDHEGSVWMATNRRGLLRFAAGQLEQVPTPHVSVICLFEDLENNLWVGMQGGGVSRICDRQFDVYNARSGLPNDIALSIAQDTGGRIWVVTQDGGLCVESDGRFRPLEPADGWVPTTPICVTGDGEGGIWVGTFSEGLVHWRDGEARRITPDDGLAGARVNALLNDREDRLWIGFEGEGVSCLAAGRMLRFTEEQGLPGRFVSTFAEDDAGRIWVGTGEGGVARFAGDRFETVIEPFDAGGIKSLLPLEDGTLWAGTGSAGLLRLRQGSLEQLRTWHGLPDDSIFQMLLDGSHRLWCGTTRGLFRVSLLDLNRVADGRADRVYAHLFGRSDGLPAFQFSNIAHPSCYRTNNGRFWFASAKGAVAFQPETFSINREPPPVILETLLADGNRHALTGAVTLPARTRVLQFKFTALSFTAPEQVRFRYRLEGWDADWIDAGPERQAEYRGIPPGSYRFQVTACNNDGVWNQRGAGLAFSIAPALWQTQWFPVSVLGLLAVSAVGTFRWVTVRRYRRRLHQLHEQHALEQERSRISQDIHDELGASLTQISMLASLANRNLDQPEEVSTDLRQITDTAREAVRAMDAIVWAINPQNNQLENFAAYTSRFAEEFLPPAGIRFRFDAPPDLPADLLGAETRHQLFLVLREGMNNIVRHARAQEVWLRLAVARGEFRVCLEDDGIGLEQSAAGPGSDGLGNMRRRIESVGGTFEVDSAAGTGTTLRISVPIIRQGTSR